MTELSLVSRCRFTLLPYIYPYTTHDLYSVTKGIPPGCATLAYVLLSGEFKPQQSASISFNRHVFDVFPGPAPLI